MMVVGFRPLWVVVAVVYALLASRFSPLSWPAMLATVPPVAVVCWLGVSGRPAAESPVVVLSRSRLVPWVVLAALGVALEVVALMRSPRQDFPTFSSIVSPLAGDSAGWYRFGGYLAWFALGVWMARR
jgi:hypothetical protein